MVVYLLTQARRMSSHSPKAKTIFQVLNINQVFTARLPPNMYNPNLPPKLQSHRLVYLHFPKAGALSPFPIPSSLLPFSLPAHFLLSSSSQSRVPNPTHSPPHSPQPQSPPRSTWSCETAPAAHCDRTPRPSSRPARCPARGPCGRQWRRRRNR